MLETTRDEQLKVLLDPMRKVKEKRPWYNVKNLKKVARTFGKTLFDKANDLVKPYLGGGSSETDAY